MVSCTRRRISGTTGPALRAGIRSPPDQAQQLPDDFEARLAEAAERDVRGPGRRVVHGSVFRRMGSVRTSILEDLDADPRNSEQARLHPQFRRAPKLRSLLLDQRRHVRKG